MHNISRPHYNKKNKYGLLYQSLNNKNEIVMRIAQFNSEEDHYFACYFAFLMYSCCIFSLPKKIKGNFWRKDMIYEESWWKSFAAYQNADFMSKHIQIFYYMKGNWNWIILVHIRSKLQIYGTVHNQERRAHNDCKKKKWVILHKDIYLYQIW